MYDTIVFDLDGTLLNTLEDLRNSTNFALNKYKDGDYIIILDQDSGFDKGYIEEVINVALEQSPELILPIIYYKNKIVDQSDWRSV